jgi:hypothetical protein
MYWIKFFEMEELKTVTFNDINSAISFIEKYLNEDDIFDSNF